MSATDGLGDIQPSSLTKTLILQPSTDKNAFVGVSGSRQEVATPWWSSSPLPRTVAFGSPACFLVAAQLAGDLTAELIWKLHCDPAPGLCMSQRQCLPPGDTAGALPANNSNKMKRQPKEQERIFTEHISDIQLISKI